MFSPISHNEERLKFKVFGVFENNVIWGYQKRVFFIFLSCVYSSGEGYDEINSNHKYVGYHVTVFFQRM